MVESFPCLAGIPGQNISVQGEESLGFLGRFAYVQLHVQKQCSGCEGRGLVLLHSKGLLPACCGRVDGWADLLLLLQVSKPSLF